jgi:deoxycytidylate deaminase
MNNKIFKKTTLYIVRTDNEGNYKNSAPCLNCFTVITELNIKKIIFSTEDNFQICKPTDYHTTHVSSGNRYMQQMIHT